MLHGSIIQYVTTDCPILHNILHSSFSPHRVGGAPRSLAWPGWRTGGTRLGPSHALVDPGPGRALSTYNRRPATSESETESDSQFSEAIVRASRHGYLDPDQASNHHRVPWNSGSWYAELYPGPASPCQTPAGPDPGPGPDRGRARTAHYRRSERTAGTLGPLYAIVFGFAIQCRAATPIRQHRAGPGLGLCRLSTACAAAAAAVM